MPSLKAIRKRIGSVRSTAKITRAMKMVSAAKLRRAQGDIERARPYAYRIRALARVLTKVQIGDWLHPLMQPRSEERTATILLITSDKGLCGSFNTNIIKRAELLASELRASGRTVNLYVIGKKAVQYHRRRNAPITHEQTGVLTLATLEKAEQIAGELAEEYLSGRTDAVWLVYNEFKSAISQRITAEKLLPVTREGLADDGEGPRDYGVESSEAYLYEPGRRQLLDRLVPRHVTAQLFRCLLESVASEHGARMTSMENATGNAIDMIDKLTLLYNRARQAAITKELVEVVSGAEAL